MIKLGLRIPVLCRASRLVLAIGLTGAACSLPSRLSAADTAELDCRASQTVVELTTQVRNGLQSDMPGLDARALQATLTDQGLQQVKAIYPGKTMHHAYYEFEVAHRARALQSALASPDPASDDYKLMTETLDLAETCQIGEVAK